MTDAGDVRARIEAALGRKEIVAILYHGGSNPGGYREILPLRITLKGKLHAKCMTSNGMKFFMFENIELTPLRTNAGVSAPAREAP